MFEEKKYYVIDAEVVADIAKHPHKEDEEYKNFLIYSDNEYPKKLIDERRPSEQPEVKEYREKTYQPVFAEVFGRVLNSLNKIQRADGFFIKYPDQSKFSKIADNEKLNVYLSEYFTQSKSLMNWAFQVCLKQYLIDANGVCIIWAGDAKDEVSYRMPQPYIVNTEDIIYHFEGESLIWETGEHQEKRFHSIDKFKYAEWKYDKKHKIVLEKELPHDLGIFPGFTLGGIVEEQEELGREYESRLKSMLPWLNVATVEFSDLQAEIVMHIHSQQWIYQDQQCGVCNGIGYIMRESEKVPCSNSKCKDGYISHSPYEPLRVRPAKTNMGEVPAPTPPMGYIQKQTEIAELQDRRINEHRYRALAAINMQFLEQTPAAQSGVAKAYDRDETNNTFYGVAIDMAQIMEKAAYLVAKWRYNLLYNDEQIKEMCPIVVVPNTFDILSSSFLIEEIKAAKDSGLNDAVLSELEYEFVNKRFANDIKLKNVLTDAHDLDPLSGLSEDEKALRISNRGATKQDYILSAYIQDFIKKAYAENIDFNNLTRDEKYTQLMKYADAKLADINKKADLIQTPPPTN